MSENSGVLSRFDRVNSRMETARGLGLGVVQFELYKTVETEDNWS